jgi:hypothetical protein
MTVAPEFAGTSSFVFFPQDPLAVGSMYFQKEDETTISEQQQSKTFRLT